ncbi:bifunctional protein-serine/threonine kinase/phosphatase [Halopseudomonas salegens]|uniref:Serine/threonine protein phosphatase PrpC n=1 Tax=Halopseudomonas salegens TaxID=1434072 RepID=A0A1H2F0E1_9GAMM|nr:bifunctional protein-serine/threonine kinase/phosphatase [Halopseudomonas salegens]SDU00817.1 Serine/threonine protein phosphatase PrpC [Halopseudomonas salegens]
MGLQIRTDEASAAGPRKDNQDALRVATPAPALATSKGHLAALADGVSQCRDGGLAARATLQALALDYYSTPETWSVTQSLERLLNAHNRWLRANGGGQPLLTTLSCLILRGRRYTLAHIGDCRVYLLRDGRLQRLTQEHVWEQPDMQHVLKRAMGLDEYPLIDYLEGELEAGDCFLLLSDGVWGHLSDSDILSCLHHSEPCKELVNSAYAAGSEDNASALLVSLDALPTANLDDVLGPVDDYAVPPRLKAGQTFEGWQVQGLAHSSQQSLCYQVSDTADQPWLLKTLPPSQADNTKAGRELLQEEWFLRRVASQSVPELHPLPERKHLYLVMRDYSGRTLAEARASEGLWSLAQLQQRAPALIHAMGLLHRRNLIHRDIKPDNVHIDSDGTLRLLDFGLAWCPGLTDWQPGLPAGTPSYMAPEVFQGAEPDPQQDIYSTGVTLYYQLTGHFPYGEIEAFQRPRFGRPTPPSRYRPDLPNWVDNWLLKALAKDPEDRYETAEEWLLALARGEDLLTPKKPLIEREPLLVWRTLALVSLSINLLAAIVWLY